MNTKLTKSQQEEIAFFKQQISIVERHQVIKAKSIKQFEAIRDDIIANLHHQKFSTEHFLQGQQLEVSCLNITLDSIRTAQAQLAKMLAAYKQHIADIAYTNTDLEIVL